MKLKKVLFALFSLMLLAPVAFADVNVSMYGLGMWNVAANGDEDVESSLASKWPGLASPYMQTSLSGSSDHMSFGLWMAPYDIADFDVVVAYIEMRPMDWIRINMGKWDSDETERGATFGSYQWYRLGVVRAADMGNFIFPSMLDTGAFLNETTKSGGMNARFYPIEGLTVGIKIPLGLSVTDGVDFGSVWANANVYARYDIDGIGTARLGWDGRSDDFTSVDMSKFNDPDDGWWGMIFGAFELNLAALPELYAAVGVRIPTLKVQSSFPASDGGRPYEVNLYANYKLDIVTPLTFHALFGTKIMEEVTTATTTTYDGFGFYVGLGVDCEVIENVSVFADVRYANSVYMNRTTESDDDNITFGVGVSKKWSNGNIGIAFVGSTNGYGNGNADVLGGVSPHRTYNINNSLTGWGDDDCGFVWAIPVKFEIFF